MVKCAIPLPLLTQWNCKNKKFFRTGFRNTPPNHTIGLARVCHIRPLKQTGRYFESTPETQCLHVLGSQTTNGLLMIVSAHLTGIGESNVKNDTLHLQIQHLEKNLEIILKGCLSSFFSLWKINKSQI